ncbi:FlgB family protein [Salipiger bermudensis]|uniref:FlgB family protein n=1 Tax=Salipiger bermudensis TaxID=344736 RepID=UPI001CD30B69|nr:FlgB family protein [Salipiger bermudensis]MCA0962615.1 FlgB family protein [Salipiger bermudensis]
MFQNLNVFHTAMALAKHSGLRQALSAQNIANADTPGYRALEIPDFEATLRGSDHHQRATRDRHLHGALPDHVPEPTLRRDSVDPNGNSVSIEGEMMTAVEASRGHGRALSIYRSSLNILRVSLGR